MLIEQQFLELKEKYSSAKITPAPSGSHLIEIPDFVLPPGWNRKTSTILFVAPPGYPAAQPDCFWLEPGGVRLANEETPHASNDSNPIPDFGQRGTWFSWHLQGWNPNQDSLLRYINVIIRRLDPPR